MKMALEDARRKTRSILTERTKFVLFQLKLLKDKWQPCRRTMSKRSKINLQNHALRVWPALIMTLRFSPRQLQLIDPCPARSAIVTAKTSPPPPFSRFITNSLPLPFSRRSYPFNYDRTSMIADSLIHRRRSQNCHCKNVESTFGENHQIPPLR